MARAQLPHECDFTKVLLQQNRSPGTLSRAERPPPVVPLSILQRTPRLKLLGQGHLVRRIQAAREAEWLAHSGLWTRGEDQEGAAPKSHGLVAQLTL